MNKTPILVLNKNAQRNKGRSAQLEIIESSKAVSDIIRTTLGPKSMLKMLLDPNGSVILTNDGASILREIDVGHPAAKTIIELSRTQDERAGDGTTSVVVLAGELMHSARRFVEEDIHPTKIVNAYHQAAEDCVKALEEIAKPFNVDSRERLVELAADTVKTKFVARFGELIPSLAVDAVRTVMVKENDGVVVDVKTLVKVEKIPGGEISDSRLVNGVMINKDILHPAMRRKIENPRIMLLDCPLEYKKAESETNIELTKAEHWKKYLDLEEEYIRDICKKICALKPDVLVTEKGVSDMAQHFLQQANVSVLRRTRKSDMQRLALACGASIGSQPGKMTPQDIGEACRAFEVRKIGDDYWSFFEPCENAKSCTVLLRGASKDVLSEIDRNLMDCLCTVRNLVVCPKIVPGGGATELALSAHLRSKALNLGEVDARPYLAAATALEIIPKTLIENCGGNVNKTISNLRAAHSAAELGAFGAGVDGNTGAVTSIEHLGIWDPLAVKSQVIKTAFDAATVLLRIDDILSGISKGKQGE